MGTRYRKMPASEDTDLCEMLTRDKIWMPAVIVKRKRADEGFLDIAMVAVRLEKDGPSPKPGDPTIADALSWSSPASRAH